MTAAADGEGDATLLELVDIAKEFVPGHGALARLLRRPARSIRALNGVTLRVRAGDVVGLVGESGSGKSTLAHVAIRLTDVTRGTIAYRGGDVTRLSRRRLQPFRRRAQIVFQDTHSSLNPRKTVRQALGDALRMRGMGRADRAGRAAALLEQVGLGARFLDRYPHELSGGQRQRVGLARALAMEPEFLIADEPVSSLDVSLQAQMLNLLMRLREDLGLTMLFISHDLAVVNRISNRVAVMYAGRIVEHGTTAEVLRAPAHPYTQALLAAIPTGRPGRPASPTVGGDAVDLSRLPPGCPFAGRCPVAMSVCRDVYPAAIDLSPTHRAECHLLGMPAGGATGSVSPGPPEAATTGAGDAGPLHAGGTALRCREE